MKHIRRFLAEGNKCKLVIVFRGREIVHPETGQAMLDQVVKAVSDIAMVEQRAMMEGRRMVMIIGPRGGVIRTPTSGPPVGGTSGPGPSRPAPSSAAGNPAARERVHPRAPRAAQRAAQRPAGPGRRRQRLAAAGNGQPPQAQRAAAAGKGQRGRFPK